MSVLHYLRYAPAVVLLLVAAFFALASTAGDNSDARALAGIMLIPALIFSALGLAAWAIAYFA